MHACRGCTKGDASAATYYMVEEAMYTKCGGRIPRIEFTPLHVHRSRRLWTVSVLQKSECNT